MFFSWIVLLVGVVLICVGSSRMSAGKAALKAAQDQFNDAYLRGFRAGSESARGPGADQQVRGQRPAPTIMRPLPAPPGPGQQGPVPPSMPVQRAPGLGSALGAAPASALRPPAFSGQALPGQAMPGQALPGQALPTHAGQASPQLHVPAPARKAPVDRRAVLINVVLGAATFLLVVAAGLWVGTRLDPIGQGVALMALSAAFYAAGLVLHQRQPRLRPVALAFSISGLALLPIVGVAWWVQFPEQGPAAWLVVSAVGTVAYLFAAVRLDSRVVAALGVVFAASGAFTFGAAMRSGIAWYAASSTLLAVLLSLVATRWAHRLPRVLHQTFVVAHRLLVPSYLAVALCVFPWLRAQDSLIITASALLYYVVQRLLAPQRDRSLTRWGARAASIGVVLSAGAVAELPGNVMLRCAAVAVVLVAGQSVWALRRDGVSFARTTAPGTTTPGALAWAERGESRRTPAILMSVAAAFALCGTEVGQHVPRASAASFLDVSLNWSWYLVLAGVVVFTLVKAMSPALPVLWRMILLGGATLGAVIEPASSRPWAGAFLLFAVALVSALQWSRESGAAWRTGFGALALGAGLGSSGPLAADLAVTLGASDALRGNVMSLVWAVGALGLGTWRAAVAVSQRSETRGGRFHWGAGALLSAAVGAGSSLAVDWRAASPRGGRVGAHGLTFDAFGQHPDPLAVTGVMVAILALAVATVAATQLFLARGALRQHLPGQQLPGQQLPGENATEPAPYTLAPFALAPFALAAPAVVLGAVVGGAGDRVLVVLVAYLCAAGLCVAGSQVWGRSWSALGATAALLMGQWQVLSMTDAPGVVVLPITAAILLAGTVVATTGPRASWARVVSASVAGALILGPWAEALRTRLAISADAVQPVAFTLLLLLAVAAVLWHARVARQLGTPVAGVSVALLAVGLTALRAVDGQWSWWWGSQVLSAYPATELVFSWAAPALVLLAGASVKLWTRHCTRLGQASAWATAALLLPAFLLGPTVLAHQEGGLLMLIGAVLGAQAFAARSLALRSAQTPGSVLLLSTSRMMPVPAAGALLCGVCISIMGQTPLWLGWIAAAAVAVSAIPAMWAGQHVASNAGGAPGHGGYRRTFRRHGDDVISVAAPFLSLIILGAVVVAGPGVTVLATAAALAYLFLAATRAAWWMGLLAFGATACAAVQAVLDLSVGAQEPRSWILVHAVLLALLPAVLTRRVAMRGRVSAVESQLHRGAGWVAAGLLTLGAVTGLAAGHDPAWLAWAVVADLVLASQASWLLLRSKDQQRLHSVVDAGMALAALAVVRAAAVEGDLRVAPFWFLVVLAAVLIGTAWWRRAHKPSQQLRAWSAAAMLTLALFTVVLGTTGTDEEWARHAVLVALFALLLVTGAAFDDAAATWIGLAGLCVDVLVAARHQTVAMLFLLAVMLFGIATWLLLRKSRQAQHQAARPPVGPPLPPNQGLRQEQAPVQRPSLGGAMGQAVPPQSQAVPPNGHQPSLRRVQPNRPGPANPPPPASGRED